ncbi:MAG: hypothetical protein ABIS86_19845 [Streptosporangiaceae bacterium]
MQTKAITLSLAGFSAVALATGLAVVNNDDVSNAQTNNAALQSKSAVKAPVATASPREKEQRKAEAQLKQAKALLKGQTTASYFWDDGSGVNGDTGAPAGGKPMQKGLFASPSWPLHTKVKVTYKGRSVTGFVGDRGPGTPSHKGIMLDLDTYTFRYLLDGKTPKSKYNAGTGEGHIKGVTWEVLSWGKGAGTKGNPRPFGA